MSADLMCPHLARPCLKAACMGYTPHPQTRSGTALWRCSVVDASNRWRPVDAPGEARPAHGEHTAPQAARRPRASLADLRWDLELGQDADSPLENEAAWVILGSALTWLTWPVDGTLPDPDATDADAFYEKLDGMNAGAAMLEAWPAEGPGPRLAVDVRAPHRALPYWHGSPTNAGGPPRLQLLVDIDTAQISRLSADLHSVVYDWLITHGAVAWESKAVQCARHLTIGIRRRAGAPTICARLLGADERGLRFGEDGYAEIADPIGMTAAEARALDAAPFGPPDDRERTLLVPDYLDLELSPEPTAAAGAALDYEDIRRGAPDALAPEGD